MIRRCRILSASLGKESRVEAARLDSPRTTYLDHAASYFPNLYANHIERSPAQISPSPTYFVHSDHSPTSSTGLGLSHTNSSEASSPYLEEISEEESEVEESKTPTGTAFERQRLFDGASELDLAHDSTEDSTRFSIASRDMSTSLSLNVWLVGDELQVGENTTSFQRTFTNEYVRPLAKKFGDRQSAIFSPSINSSHRPTHRRRRSSIFDKSPHHPDYGLRLIITLKNEAEASFQFLLDALAPLLDLDVLTSYDVASNHITTESITIFLVNELDQIKSLPSPRFIFFDAPLLELKDDNKSTICPIASMEWKNEEADESLWKTIAKAVVACKDRGISSRVWGVRKNASEGAVQRLKFLGVDLIEFV